METPGYISGSRTPTDLRHNVSNQKRKTTLISLIDELTTLRDEENEKERIAKLMFDEKRDGRELAFRVTVVLLLGISRRSNYLWIFWLQFTTIEYKRKE